MALLKIFFPSVHLQFRTNVFKTAPKIFHSLIWNAGTCTVLEKWWGQAYRYIQRRKVAIPLMHVTPFVPTTLTNRQRHAGRLRHLNFLLKIFQRHAKSAQRHVPYSPESCRKMHLASREKNVRIEIKLCTGVMWLVPTAAGKQFEPLVPGHIWIRKYFCVKMIHQTPRDMRFCICQQLCTTTHS